MANFSKGIDRLLSSAINKKDILSKMGGKK